MLTWWKKNTNLSKDFSMNNPTKTNRSLVSFFVDKEKQEISNTDVNRKTMKSNSIAQVHPSIDHGLSQQNREAALTYYQRQSQLPKQWQHANLNDDIQIKIKDDSEFQTHFNEYLQLLTELIRENESCFGFSLFHMTSKYSLYLTIIIFLGVSLIISLTAILK